MRVGLAYDNDELVTAFEMGLTTARDISFFDADNEGDVIDLLAFLGGTHHA